MAFKVLSQEEIAVLNEHEKKAYEQAYQEYLERTSFVERLEQLDKVRMPQVSVKKRGIKKIKPPVIPTIKAQEVTVDSAIGVNLLNATKMIKHITDNNANLSAQINYKASLPSVLISVPESVKTSESTPFVISKLSSVPIVEPVAINCEMAKFNAVIPEMQDIRMPELKENEIDHYSITDIPSVRTELPTVPQVNSNVDFTASLPCVKVATPNVESVEIAHSDVIVTKAVPVMRPANINVSIENYQMTQTEMKAVEMPIVEYTEPKNQMVSLSDVPIPEYTAIPVLSNNVAIEIPSVESVSTPDVSITICTAEITAPKEICLPTLAPEIHIETSEVTAIQPPMCSTPEEICYSEPSCSVVINPIPVISVPQVDTDAVLEKILSKIR